jgi:hypothetical protein
MKLGIIQSRGLGDIVIALPIARHYYDQGWSVYWPVCEEFISSLDRSVPWVTWIPVVTDPQGLYFFDEPLRLLRQLGVEEDNILYLYQYLSSRPDLTDPELFNILKFDQYKYWVSEVPFIKKWTLNSCITRDLKRENKLTRSLKLGSDPYAVVHLSGSSFRADIDLGWLADMRVVNVDLHLTDSVWDWLSVLEGASVFVGVDSVFANIVDSWQISIPQRYWIRRSAWDLTPVLGGNWTIVPTSLKIVEPVRVDVQAQTRAQQSQSRAVSHVPFQAQGQIPTSYMQALKK